MSYEYQDDPYCDKECFDCNQKEVKLDDAKYWLQAVLDYMYTDEVLHIDLFESCLEQLCRSLGMQIPDARLTMEKVGNTLLTPINPIKRTYDLDFTWWKIMSQNHAKQTITK